MNSDKVTTMAGATAAVCTGVLGAAATGLVVITAPVTSALVIVGTISGVIFSFFTNKPNPFVNPLVKK